MAITETANLLKNQASTAIKDKILALNKTSAKEGDETTGVDGTTGTNASSGNEDVKEQFNTFLLLLTAQIENQDPLAPLDSTQFVEQLATFSGLELQAKGNNSLDRIEQLLTRQIALIDEQQI